MPKLTPVLSPDHPLYEAAVEAMRRYHQAQLEGDSTQEVERLRLIAEFSFQTVTDYQLRALRAANIADSILRKLPGNIKP